MFVDLFICYKQKRKVMHNLGQTVYRRHCSGLSGGMCRPIGYGDSESDNVRLCMIAWWRGLPSASRIQEQGSSVLWNRASARPGTRHHLRASSPSWECSTDTTANSLQNSEILKSRVARMSVVG